MPKNTEDTHIDFHLPVASHVESLDWVPSPSETVWRRTLYREGGEPGPVTSFVRFTRDSRFPPHGHPEGEEILVLEGVFSDETGDYPAGTFLLNPSGSAHSPGSREGCLLFVHLRQYAGTGRAQCALDTNAQAWRPTANERVLEKLLYSQEGFSERISLQLWHPGAHVTLPPADRHREILILQGGLDGSPGAHRATTWLRFPASHTVELHSGTGATVYFREA